MCVYVCVCLLVTNVSRAKTAEPIETPCGLWAPRGPRNHMGLDPPREATLFGVGVILGHSQSYLQSIFSIYYLLLNRSAAASDYRKLQQIVYFIA